LDQRGKTAGSGSKKGRRGATLFLLGRKVTLSRDHGWLPLIIISKRKERNWESWFLPFNCFLLSKQFAQ
jgi:hypothetical protein